MASNHENGSNVGTTAEIRLIYDEAIDVSREIDTLKDQAQQLDIRRSRLIQNMQNKIRETDLPQDAKILAAALLRFPRSAEQIQANVEIMTDISEKAEAFAGQAAIWFTSKESMTLHRFLGPNEYETTTHLNLGVLDNEAALIINFSGGLLIPMHKTERMAIITCPGKENDYKFEAIDIGTPLPESDWWPYSNIDIPLLANLGKATLIMGDEAVEHTISKTYSSTQKVLNEMKDRLTATLF